MFSNIAKISESVHFIGAFDPQIHTFDIITKTANGSSYNSLKLCVVFGREIAEIAMGKMVEIEI
ncbi:MAG: hypothetical protein WC665_02900 [Sulfurimonas sp.]